MALSYNKVPDSKRRGPQTPAQKVAASRNFALFRLKGMSLPNIAYNLRIDLTEKETLLRIAADFMLLADKNIQSAIEAIELHNKQQKGKSCLSMKNDG